MAPGFFDRLLSQSATWLILVGLVAPLPPAFAQTNGRFTLDGSFTYSYDKLQHGSTTFAAGHLEGGAIVSSGRGALFTEGQSFLMSCVVFSESSADDLNLKAPCTLTEPKEGDGDELFVLLSREDGNLGGGMGHGDLVGGTGKYANITGQCSYETRYLSTSILVTTYDCTWGQS